MSKTIVNRLYRILYLSIFFSFVLCVFISGSFIKNKYDSIILETQKSTNLMFNTFRFILLDTDKEKSKSVLKYYSNIADIHSIVIYDMYGNLFLQYENNINHDPSLINITVPLYNKDIKIGDIEITIYIKTILQSLISDIILVLLLFVFFNIILTIFIYKIINIIIKPINQLTIHTNDIINDNYVCIYNENMDEIGDLVNVFNSMINSLYEKDKHIKNHTKILEKEIEIQTKKLKNINSLYAGILNTQVDLIIRVNLDNDLLYANKKFIDTFKVNDITKFNCIKNTNIHPDDVHIFEEAYHSVICEEPYRVNVEFRCILDNEIKWFKWEAFGVIINDIMSEIQVIGKDITEEKTNKELLTKNLELDKSANKILINIAKRRNIKEILDDICYHLEKHDDGIFASILLNNKDDILHLKSAPSMNDQYKHILKNGIYKDDSICCNGISEHNNNFFITENIKNSDSWKKYKELYTFCIKNDFKSCWSYPISDTNGNILAILDIYSINKEKPNDNNLKYIEWVSTIIKLAIEQYNNDKELKCIQNELDEKNKQYEILIESLNDCIYRTDNDFKFVYISSKITDILGMQPSELKNKELKEIFLSVDDSVKDIYNSSSDVFKDISFTGYNVKAHKYVDLEFDIQSYIYKNEKLGYQGIIRDVTLEKQLKEKIEYSDKMLINLMNSSPLALLVLDDEHNILYKNNKVNDIKLPIKNNKFLMNEVKKSKDQVKIEKDADDKDSIVIETEVNGNLYDFIFKRISYDFKDCQLLFIKNINDKKKIRDDLNKKVKERTKELEEKTTLLSATNSDLEQFAHAISHDLQSPIRNLNLNINILKRSKKDELSEDIIKRLDKIEGLTIYLDTLIKGILQLSRQTKGNVKRKMNNMSKKIKEDFNLFVSQYNIKNAELQIPEEFYMNCDYNMMSSVFQNLINNAIKFSQDKEKIIININSNNDVYYVKDNGIGIPDDIPQDEIFKIFKTNKEKNSGTGIGLSTVKRIIEKHNGKIWYESKVGEGTTFYFTIG